MYNTTAGGHFKLQLWGTVSAAQILRVLNRSFNHALLQPLRFGLTSAFRRLHFAELPLSSACDPSEYRTRGCCERVRQICYCPQGNLDCLVPFRCITFKQCNIFTTPFAGIPSCSPEASVIWYDIHLSASSFAARSTCFPESGSISPSLNFVIKLFACSACRKECPACRRDSDNRSTDYQTHLRTDYQCRAAAEVHTQRCV